MQNVVPASTLNNGGIIFSGTSTAGSAPITSSVVGGIGAGVSFNGNSDGGNASLITISTAFVTFAPTLAA